MYILILIFIHILFGSLFPTNLSCKVVESCPTVFTDLFVEGLIPGVWHTRPLSFSNLRFFVLSDGLSDGDVRLVPAYPTCSMGLEYLPTLQNRFKGSVNIPVSWNMFFDILGIQPVWGKKTTTNYHR